ncbi:MAG: DUF4339 domain-containing protein [Ginsengibacter sp.]
MTHYFLKDGKTEIGPLTIEQLKCRLVNKNTPVWFAGLEEWTTVENVYELKELFNTQSTKANTGFFTKMWSKLFKKQTDKKHYQVAFSKNRNQLN